VDQLRRGPSAVPSSTLDDVSAVLDLVASRLSAAARDPELTARVQSLAQALERGGGDAITAKRKKGLAETLNGLAARIQ
jgi:hypothetical protein